MTEEPKTWKEMRDQCARLLHDRTGEDLDAWNRRIAALNPGSRNELRDWLEQQGVTGYSRMLLIMERFGYPDFFTASADELIRGQYRGRAELRPILDAVLAVVHGLGPVTVQARKGYVSLLTPRRTFAVVKPSTRTRVDVGVRLDGEAPSGRLLAGKGLANETINLRLPLASPDDLDPEACAILERAYRRNS